jgi:hypothetical protein
MSEIARAEADLEISSNCDDDDGLQVSAAHFSDSMC